jgi:hypothetical protein
VRLTSDVTVEGACVVKGRSALIEGDLTVSPGAVLVAAFGSSNLTVEGDLQVQSGATLILGCAPSPEFPCLDDKTGSSPGSSQGSVSGNLSSQQPLGVVVHNSTIGGNVQETGGGGDSTCNEGNGPTVEGFYVFGGGVFGKFPVYSDYSDSTVNGNLSVTGLKSCWLGVTRVHVGRPDQGREQDGNRGEQDGNRGERDGNRGEQDGNGGNVQLINNQLLDEDAIEILSNQISGNLVCDDNSHVWDSNEVKPPNNFPRELDRNTVSGDRVGECVLAGPLTKGGPLAGGPF